MRILFGGAKVQWLWEVATNEGDIVERIPQEATVDRLTEAKFAELFPALVAARKALEPPLLEKYPEPKAEPTSE